MKVTIRQFRPGTPTAWRNVVVDGRLVGEARNLSLFLGPQASNPWCFRATGDDQIHVFPTRQMLVDYVEKYHEPSF